MKTSPYYEQRKMKEKKKAVALYKQGLTLREIGKILGWSYEWVRLALIELGAVENSKV